MDFELDRFDLVAAKSPTKIQTGEAMKISAMRVREPSVETEELRPLEMNPDDGKMLEGRMRSFALPQPIMERMVVDAPAPQERSEISVNEDGIAQSTPTVLPRGPQQPGQATLRKQRVTFATSPFKEKGMIRSVQSEITPRGGGQRRTIFEDDMFGTPNIRKRTPAKSSQKHTALVGVLNEIQEVIVKQIKHQFEVAEEEARFARNDVHDEALNDFKKMHSQRAIRFNELVDLETAYATQEKALVAGYEAILAANAEILGHVQQQIRQHDEGNLVGRLPKTLRKGPVSALMTSYLK